jgi:hypothetical protein
MVILIDSTWQPAAEGDNPPPEAVLGGWREGRFDPNPLYRPSDPDSPTDPAEAVLRLVLRGEADGAELLPMLQHAVLGVAVDKSGVVLVVRSPDGVPCVLVTTAPAHRASVPAPGWQEGVSLADIAEALPAQGIDVLLNPGSRHSMRVLADAVKRFVDGEEPASGPGAEG